MCGCYLEQLVNVPCLDPGEERAFACLCVLGDLGLLFDTLGHVAELNEQPPNLRGGIVICPAGGGGGKKYVKPIAEMAVDNTALYAVVDLQDSRLVKYLGAQPFRLGGRFSRQALAVHRIYLARRSTS